MRYTLYTLNVHFIKSINNKLAGIFNLRRQRPPSCSPIIIYRRIAANIHILRLITKAIFWMLLRVAHRNRSLCKQVRVNRSCILITCALSINLLLCTANKSAIAFTARPNTQAPRCYNIFHEICTDRAAKTTRARESEFALKLLS